MNRAISPDGELTLSRSVTKWQIGEWFWLLVQKAFRLEFVRVRPILLVVMERVCGYRNEGLFWNFDSVELAVDQRLAEDLRNARVHS